MAYYDIFLLGNDQDFMNRNWACAETEGVPDAMQWALDHRVTLAATPGFGDKYASALVAEVENPGRDQSVISDGDILSAVQALLIAEGSI